jgi:diaminopimelate epimerase
MELDFVKMHGIGNDFVVLDARPGGGAAGLVLSQDQARHLADRHFGIGCDQFLIIASADVPEADITMLILNSDGSEAKACGNGSRCVADLVMAETDADELAISTKGGLIHARRVGDDVSIDMGIVKLDWADIPLAQAMDTMAVDLGRPNLPPAITVNMGNPHAVHIVDDAEAIDLAAIGPILEHHEFFPERANIEFISRLDQDVIRMRVWERGSGITIACGTGACASAVAAARAGLTGRQVEVVLDGGRLSIDWREDGHVIMTGPSTISFYGRIDLDDDQGLA